MAAKKPPDDQGPEEPLSIDGMTPEEAIQRMFGVTQKPARDIYKNVALAFANALATGDFNRAQEMLTPELRKGFSPSQLKEHYDQMIAYAGKTVATDVELGWAFEGFPEDTDECSAYVTIGGPHEVGGSWSEAVTVILDSRSGEPLIRFIDWGRP